MITSWNEAEDEALQGLSLRAQIIYLRGLRRHMNYQSGIVGGEERRISLKMLGEISEEFINRQQHQPNKKQVIVSLDQLKKAGLIERIPDPDYLVFFMPLATADKSVRNNHGTTTAQPRHNHGTDHGANYGTEKPREYEASEGNNGTDRDIPKKGELFAPPRTTAHIRSPVSGIRNTTKELTGSLEGVGCKNEKQRAIALPDWLNQDAWKLFELHRKKKRKPIDDLSRPILLAKLDGLSAQQQQTMIEYSISAGYPDLYPDCLTRPQAAKNERSSSRRETLNSLDF